MRWHIYISHFILAEDGIVEVYGLVLAGSSQARLSISAKLQICHWACTVMEHFGQFKATHDFICEFSAHYGGEESEMALVMSTVLRELVQVFMSKEFILGMLTALTGTFLFSRLRQAQRTVASIPPIKPKKQTKYDDNIKMVILVRSDLNMTKGKAAAQACHAVLASYKDASKRDPSLLEAWERSGQAKVTLKVESEEELMGLVRKAREYGVTAQYIRDAGRTQLAPNTTTVAAVGPAPCNLLDLVTGHLKLY